MTLYGFYTAEELIERRDSLQGIPNARLQLIRRG